MKAVIKNIIFIVCSFGIITLRPVLATDEIKYNYSMERVKRISPGNQLRPFDNNTKVAFFVRKEPTILQALWISNGTEVGTVKVKEGFSRPRDLIESNGKLFFRSTSMLYGEEVWVSDGTSDGTFMLKDINPGSESSCPDSCDADWKPRFVPYKGLTYFVANHEVLLSGHYLWQTDGSTDGTVMASFARKMNLDRMSIIMDVTVVNDVLVIYIEKDYSGVDPATTYIEDEYQLWFSDGTYEGTLLQKALPGPARDIEPWGDSKLFFAIPRNDEIWITDGTIQGTHVVRSGVISSNFTPNKLNCDSCTLTKRDGKLPIMIRDRYHGRELWATDGTEDGTVLVKDIVEGPESSKPFITVFNHTSIMIPQGSSIDLAIWKTDGTTDGTQSFFEFYPGMPNPALKDVEKTDSTLFILGASSTSDVTDRGIDEGIKGRTIPTGATQDLFVTDGTESNTQLLGTINTLPPGGTSVSSRWIGKMRAVGDTLYFGQYSVDNQGELWKVTRTIAICEESESSKFLLRINVDGIAVLKSCEWLRARSQTKKETICEARTATLGEYGTPKETCPKTCNVCV